MSARSLQASPVNPRIEVRAVGRKGRGVFAAVPIGAGDLLEAAPTVEITDDIVPGSRLDDYPFAHPDDPKWGLIVFGLVSLMNHADDPNTVEAKRHVEGLGWIVETRAARDIAPGEEITRRYVCELWFEPEKPG